MRICEDFIIQFGAHKVIRLSLAKSYEFGLMLTLFFLSVNLDLRFSYVFNKVLLKEPYYF